MIYDYYYLNGWTIKNNYPLSLILGIVEYMKKIFTKLDLYLEYNNMQIKEENECKTVFMTLKGSFKLIVMFFRLTNSLATFQTIMNKIFRNFINTREVVSFIDNMIVEMEKEEEHNEIVKVVVKRLVDNNLYIKYKQKIQEVGFLRVIIGLEGIKIKKKKVKGILEQPTLKKVKEFLGLANYYQQFIKDFAVVARPLHDMVKKDQKQD